MEDSPLVSIAVSHEGKTLTCLAPATTSIKTNEMFMPWRVGLPFICRTGFFHLFSKFNTGFCSLQDRRQHLHYHDWHGIWPPFPLRIPGSAQKWVRSPTQISQGPIWTYVLHSPSVGHTIVMVQYTTTRVHLS